MLRVGRWLSLIGVGLSVVLLTAIASAADPTWPREMKTDLGVLTIYQPQPEKFADNVLEGRAALSLIPKGKSEPVFGVMWFKCRVDTDRDSGNAMLRDIVVTNSRWPESDSTKEMQFSMFLTQLMPKTGVPISLTRLQQSLATADLEQKSVEGLKNDPPKIIVVEEKSQLLLYDGEPKTLAIPNTDDYDYVANCAFAVIKEKKTGTYYLSGGKIWYTAKDPKGPWTSVSAPPAEIAQMVPKDTTATPAPNPPPRIVTATEPSELIAFDGKPNWQPIGNGELTYVTNTESKVVREVASGKIFVLVSGRWFTAASFDGPWTVVRPDQLPPAFKDIPPASALGAVRVSVAGTPEANGARLDAFVAQTSAIDKSKAKLEVKYDGDPKFKQIEFTAVEYATNTQSQVLRINSKYYACDNAVWYISDKATGP